ncbi:MAG: DUF58 domain-containing protein [Treponema sp.]
MRHFLTGAKDSLSKKAAYLRLQALALSDSLKAGGFKSPRRGQGMELSGVREYMSGDDVRTIDWNVTARMAKTYVKTFEEEHEIPVFLIVDRSASMFTGIDGRIKYNAAAECASLIALAGDISANPVGAVFFDGEIAYSCRPEYGRTHTMTLLARLDEVSQIKRGSALPAAIKGVAKLLKNRALIFIISDFRTADWEDDYKLLAQKNDLTLIRIADFQDEALPNAGALPFCDAESSAKRIFPTSSKAFRSAWRASFRERTERLQKLCAQYGAHFLSVSAEEDAARALSRYFASRSK